MGCCLGVLLLAGAPRIALVLWWFLDPSHVAEAFAAWPTAAGGLVAPSCVWPLAGLLALPWTTVAYVFFSPGGLIGFEWVFIVIALLMDLGALGGGGRAYRQRRSTD